MDSNSENLAIISLMKIFLKAPDGRKAWEILSFSLFILFIVSIFLFGVVVPTKNSITKAQTPTFYQDLSLGSNGADVLELQKLLNSDPQTRVATYGVGSPGQETDYFGNLTHNAVIRFQNKYASEILAPVGLTSGTGYFGPSTRAKANELVGAVSGDNFGSENNSDSSSDQNQTNTQNSTTITVTNEQGSGSNSSDASLEATYLELLQQISTRYNLSLEANIIKKSFGLRDDSKLTLVRSSTRNPLQNETIKLYGAGFRYGQRAFLGTTEASGILINPYELEITIPGNIDSGLYPVFIYDQQGKPRFSETVDVYIGSNDNDDRPIVLDFEFEDDELIIYGDNFSEFNSVYTRVGLFRNIKSTDPTKIVIGKEYTKLSPYLSSLKDKIELVFYVQVLGTSGISNSLKKESFEINP
jgi:hypothetical protein